jgi:hypothetical protein
MFPRQDGRRGVKGSSFRVDGPARAVALALKASVRLRVSCSVGRHIPTRLTFCVLNALSRRIAQVVLGREVVARAEPVRARGDIERGTGSGHQVLDTVAIVEIDVVVLFLADRDVRQERQRARAAGAAASADLGSPAACRIAARRSPVAPPPGRPREQAGAAPESPGGHAHAHITRRQTAGRAFRPRLCAGARAPDDNA